MGLADGSTPPGDERVTGDGREGLVGARFGRTQRQGEPGPHGAPALRGRHRGQHMHLELGGHRGEHGEMGGGKAGQPEHEDALGEVALDPQIECAGPDGLDTGRQPLRVGGGVELLLHRTPQLWLPELERIERGTERVDIDTGTRTHTSGPCTRGPGIVDVVAGPAPHHGGSVQRVAIEEIGDGAGTAQFGALVELGAAVAQDVVHGPGERTGAPGGQVVAVVLAERPAHDGGGEDMAEIGDDAVVQTGGGAEPAGELCVEPGADAIAGHDHELGGERVGEGTREFLGQYVDKWFERPRHGQMKTHGTTVPTGCDSALGMRAPGIGAVGISAVRISAGPRSTRGSRR